MDLSRSGPEKAAGRGQSISGAAEQKGRLNRSREDQNSAVRPNMTRAALLTPVWTGLAASLPAGTGGRGLFI